MPWIDGEIQDRIEDSLAVASNIEGLTHGFYHYPARFSPAVVRAVVEVFTRRNDWVLDPFMGGGTSVVESLALGRRAVGCDINRLATFVAETRTAPLSARDQQVIKAWVSWVSDTYGRLVRATAATSSASRMLNMPNSLWRFLSGALELVGEIESHRGQRFARCLLLRLAQWSMDGRERVAPQRRRLAQRMNELADEMLTGLDELAARLQPCGVRRSQISCRRVLMNAPAESLSARPRLARLDSRPRLVVTSPPYPGVHVLYHRWQLRGRRETPAPYHIAGVEDGHPASYYTAGSRTPSGIENYFDIMARSWSSIRSVLSRGASIFQIIGFSDMASQLPRYQRMMLEAGFEPIQTSRGNDAIFFRSVKNRKWYHRIRSQRNGGTEVAMLHYPRPVGAR